MAGTAGLMTPPKLVRLRKRRDFLRIAATRRKKVTPAFILQAAARQQKDDAIGIGFTATRKIGSAVVRNRARRRLREAARQVLPATARPGTDYVLIARAASLSRSFEHLKADLARAVRALSAGPSRGGSPSA